jgi:thiol-disulfide isomerase/thioredoxin
VFLSYSIKGLLVPTTSHLKYFLLKRYLLKYLTLLVPLLLLSQPASSSNLPNKLVNLPIKLLSGNTVSLANYQGKKAVYIKFWATWCQPCLKEMTHFQHVQKNFADKIKVIAINIGINESFADINKVKKQYNLTMDMAIDESGNLAQAFNFIGTPYHLLFDKNLNLIHKGHQANNSLDQKLTLVSNLKPTQLLDSHLLDNSIPSININFKNGQIHALFFTATWCDWYLKESRSRDAKNCISGQNYMNKLALKYPEINWQTIVSRLWTDKSQLDNYKEKYQLNHAIAIDQSNQLFHQYTINNLPSLILIKNNTVIKITDLKNIDHIEKNISTM